MIGEAATAEGPDVRLEPLPNGVQRVAACVSGDRDGLLQVAVVVCDLPELLPCDYVVVHGRAEGAYAPGQRGPRETGVIVSAVERLAAPFDALLCNGHGLAHPDRCGLACHVGARLDRPTIGCAGRLLAGEHEPVGPLCGDRSEIRLEGQVVGYALRTRHDVQPLYVSPGHRCDPASAVALVWQCCAGFRLPEPLRQARTLRRTGRL
jgi:deoxyribonuclease V